MYLYVVLLFDICINIFILFVLFKQNNLPGEINVDNLFA